MAPLTLRATHSGVPVESTGSALSASARTTVNVCLIGFATPATESTNVWRPAANPSGTSKSYVTTPFADVRWEPRLIGSECTSALEAADAGSPVTRNVIVSPCSTREPSTSPPSDTVGVATGFGVGGTLASSHFSATVIVALSGSSFSPAG